MSSKIERDLSLANKLGIRSIFFSENAITEDYAYMKSFKPDFHVMNHLHFPSVLKQIDRDIEYLEEKFCDKDSSLNYLHYLHELPNQDLINVGVDYHYGKNNPENYVANTGVFINSDRLRYFQISLYVPLEHQAPFNVIVCKLINLYKDSYDEESKRKINLLEEYCEENDVVLINKSEHVKYLFSRYQWFTIANAFLLSEECKQIWEKFNKIARTSKMIFIDREKTSNKDYIEDLMRESCIDYPIVIKSDKTFNSKFSHTKHFITNSDGLNDLFDKSEFLKEDLSVEELVPHSEDLLIKIHWFSDKTLFWRVDGSIPESYFKSSVYLDQNSEK